MGKQGPCNHCGVAVTPLWRNGPPEKPVLCNACGSRWRTRGSLVNYMPLHAGGLGLSSAAATKWRLKNAGTRQQPQAPLPGAANGKRAGGQARGGAAPQHGDAEAWFAKKGSRGAAEGGGARTGRGLRGGVPGVKRKVWQRAHGGSRGGERGGSVGGCGLEGRSGAEMGRGGSEEWDEAMELDMMWGDEDEGTHKGAQWNGATDSNGHREGWASAGGSGEEGSDEVMLMDDDGSTDVSHRLQGVPVPPKRRSLGGGGPEAVGGMRPRSQSEADLTALRLRTCAQGDGAKAAAWRGNGVRSRGEKGAKRERDMEVDAGYEGSAGVMVEMRTRHTKMGVGGGGREGNGLQEETWDEELGHDALGGRDHGVVAVQEGRRDEGEEEEEEEEEEGDEDGRLELLQHVPSGQRELVLLTMPPSHYRSPTATDSTATAAGGAGVSVVGKGTREQALGAGRGERVGMQRVASDGSIGGDGARMPGRTAARGERGVGKEARIGATKRGGAGERSGVASSPGASDAVTDDFLLFSPHSPLCSLNLSDVVNASSLYRCMDHAAKCQLVAMLPAVDTANGSASVESMFRSKVFLGALSNFQNLLSQGMFHAPSLPAETAHLFSSLTSTSCLDLSASGWWHRWVQAHPAITTATHTSSPPSPAAAIDAAALTAPRATALALPSAAPSELVSTVTPATALSPPPPLLPPPPPPAPAPPAPPAPDPPAPVFPPASHRASSAVSPTVSQAPLSSANVLGASASVVKRRHPSPAVPAHSAAPCAAAAATAADSSRSPALSTGGGGSSSPKALPSPVTPSGTAPPRPKVPLQSPSASTSPFVRCHTPPATTAGAAVRAGQSSSMGAVTAVSKGVGVEAGVVGVVSASQGRTKPAVGVAAVAAAAGTGTGHKALKTPTLVASSTAASATAGPFPTVAASSEAAARNVAAATPLQQQQQARGRGAVPLTAKAIKGKQEDEEGGTFAALCGHVKVPQHPQHTKQVARDPSRFALSSNFFAGSSLSASPPTGTTPPSPPPFPHTFLPASTSHPSSSAALSSPFHKFNSSAAAGAAAAGAAAASLAAAAVAPAPVQEANTWQRLAAAAAAARPPVVPTAPVTAAGRAKGGLTATLSASRAVASSLPQAPAAAGSGAVGPSGPAGLGSRYTLGEGVLNGRLIVARSVDMFSDPLRDNLMWDSSSTAAAASSVIVPHGATAMQEPLD